MAWLVLIIAGLFEVAWASLLPATKGFTKVWPTVAFGAALAVSMYLLSIAARTLPIGTAYAVWVGIGAALTVGWAMATGIEPFSVLKVLFIAGIVGCAAGLKALPASAKVQEGQPV